MAILLVGFTTLPTNAALTLTDSPRAGLNNKSAAKNDVDGIRFTEASWRDILKKAKEQTKVIFLDA